MANRADLLQAEEPGALARAAAALARGDLVVFPTDTVYGVGAHGLISEYAVRLFQAKVRPKGKPIALLIAPEQRLEDLARDIPPEALLLARRFWPGDLSIILRRLPVVPDVLAAGGPTIALRMPNHPVAIDLIRRLGAPIAATSANLSGRPAPVVAADAYRELGRRVSIVLDGGRCPGGVASTVLDLTQPEPTIVRVGSIPREEIEAILGREVIRA